MPIKKLKKAGIALIMAIIMMTSTAFVSVNASQVSTGKPPVDQSVNPSGDDAPIGLSEEISNPLQQMWYAKSAWQSWEIKNRSVSNGNHEWEWLVKFFYYPPYPGFIYRHWQGYVGYGKLLSKFEISFGDGTSITYFDYPKGNFYGWLSRYNEVVDTLDQNSITHLYKLIGKSPKEFTMRVHLEYRNVYVPHIGPMPHNDNLYLGGLTSMPSTGDPVGWLERNDVNSELIEFKDYESTMLEDTVITFNPEKPNKVVKVTKTVKYPDSTSWHKQLSVSRYSTVRFRVEIEHTGRIPDPVEITEFTDYLPSSCYGIKNGVIGSSYGETDGNGAYLRWIRWFISPFYNDTMAYYSFDKVDSFGDDLLFANISSGHKCPSSSWIQLPLSDGVTDVPQTVPPNDLCCNCFTDGVKYSFERYGELNHIGPNCPGSYSGLGIIEPGEKIWIEYDALVTDFAEDLDCSLGHVELKADHIGTYLIPSTDPIYRLFDSDGAVVNCVSRGIVDKKVWDENAQAWVERIDAAVGDVVKFKCSIKPPQNYVIYQGKITSFSELFNILFAPYNDKLLDRVKTFIEGLIDLSKGQPLDPVCEEMFGDIDIVVPPINVYYFKDLSVIDILPDSLEYISSNIEIEYKGMNLSRDPRYNDYTFYNDGNLKWDIYGDISYVDIIIEAEVVGVEGAINRVTYAGNITSCSSDWHIYEETIVEALYEIPILNLHNTIYSILNLHNHPYQSRCASKLLTGMDSAFINGVGTGSIKVDKKVRIVGGDDPGDLNDPSKNVQVYWFDNITAPVDTTLAFYIRVENNGDYELENVFISDEPSKIFGDVGGLSWNYDLLAPGEVIYKNFELTIINDYEDPIRGNVGFNAVSTCGTYSYLDDPGPPSQVNPGNQPNVITETICMQDIVNVTVTSNNSPKICCEAPSTDSTDVSICISELSVVIEDPEGDSFEWSIETKPDIGSASGTDDLNGTKILFIDAGLQPETTYTWTVEAKDSGSGKRSTAVFNFTTVEINYPPESPTDPYPNDGQHFVEISTTLSIYVHDPNDDSMDVSFYDASDNSLIDIVEDAPSESRTEVIRSDLEYDTSYEWYVIADDKKGGITQSDIWSFTTEESPYPDNQAPDNPSNPSPADTAENVDIVHGELIYTELGVFVSDSDGDSMDVSFYDASDDGLIDIVEDIPSESRTEVIWPDLEYDTSYEWYVIADDKKGGITQSDIWSFTTLEYGLPLPEVFITKPLEEMWYRNNEVKRPFFATIIIGAIDIEATVIDPTLGLRVKTVSYFIDGNEVYSCEYNLGEPSQNFSYTWDETSIGLFTIKVAAFDESGDELASHEIDVIAFVF